MVVRKSEVLFVCILVDVMVCWRVFGVSRGR